MSNSVLMIFMICLTLTIIQFALILFFIISTRYQKRFVKTNVTAISVLIPFRNEVERIEKLIRSINKQQVDSTLIELIFIDDYSTDSSSAKITSTLQIQHKIIPNTLQQGKKYALTTGALAAHHTYILTLDADVSFHEHFFETILEIERADLVILPVSMTGTTLIGEFASIEFNWMQKITFGNPTPILCNGANLLFKKEAYLDSIRTRTDFDIASGDDIFLMQYLQKKNASILRINNPLITVNTNAPGTLADLLSQRKRWSGKFKKMATPLGTMLILFVVAVQVVFIISFALSLLYPAFIIILLLKLFGELIFGASANKNLNSKRVLSICIHQFWYPIYLLLLTFPTRQNNRWGKNS